MREAPAEIPPGFAFTMTAIGRCLVSQALDQPSRWRSVENSRVPIWWADFTIVSEGGGPVVKELRFRCGGELPPGGLPSHLTRLRFQDALDVARNELRKHMGDDWGKRALESAGFTKSSIREQPRRPGKSGRDDLFYARFAAGYVKHIRRGSRTPVTDLAKELGYSQAYVRDVLHDARSPQRDLLTDAPNRGKAGGALTPKARQLLEADQERES